MGDFLSQGWAALIAVALPIFSTLGATFYQWFLAHLPKNQHSLISRIVQDVVEGVEQVRYAVSLPPEAAKQLAMVTVSQQLAHWHVSIPTNVLDILVEQAVLHLPHAAPTQQSADTQPAINPPTVGIAASVAAANAKAPADTAQVLVGAPVAPAPDPAPADDSPTTVIAALNKAGDTAKV